MTGTMTLPRRLPEQKRSEDTVLRIMNAAEALLSRIPLEFVTTSRIAKEARMSVGALYRFYTDKQAIFDAVAVRHMARFREWLAIRVMRPLERDMAADIPKIDPPKFLEDVL